MKGKLNIYYDEEGDILELVAGKYNERSYKNLGNGAFGIIDNKTHQIRGIAIKGLTKRTEGLKEISLNLPVKIKLS